MVEYVSVVTAVYNGERYLHRGLQSILNQDLQDFEYVIVDDGSTDKTPDLLEEVAQRDSRLKVVRAGRVGFASALNLGVARARGALVARQDIDDISSPDRLRKQMNLMRSMPDVGVMGCAFRIVDERRGEEYVRRPPADDASLRRTLSQYIPFAHTTVMFRKTAWEQVGMYKDTTGQDLLLWIQMAAAGWKLAAVQDVLGTHFVHDTSFFFTTYEYEQRVRKLARMHFLAVQELDLPRWHYVYPFARLAYLYLPNFLKRSVRRAIMRAETTRS